MVPIRAASPAAAEGRPRLLALVAALLLGRQMDIWTETKEDTNKSPGSTQGQRQRDREGQKQ